ncbi:MAG: class I SAM-dependent methyltransferase [Candidatus Njordarchaeia archaeon]
MSIESFYSNFENLENYDPSSSIGKTRMKFWEKFLLERKNIVGKKALELACGGGILSFTLAKMGVDVVGVDIQKDMLEMAKRYSDRHNLNARFILGNIKNLELGEKFDSIFLVGNSIAHFSLMEFEQIIGTVKKHLHLEGHFIVEFSDAIWEIFTGNLKLIPKADVKEKIEVSYNPFEGSVNILKVKRMIRNDFFEAERHSLYIWSPWLLRYVMEKNGFKKVEGLLTGFNIYIEIFQLI